VIVFFASDCYLPLKLLLNGFLYARDRTANLDGNLLMPGK
jgi:hypothetical protein